MSTVDELKTGSRGDGPDTESSRVEFTSEQQTRVQALIDDAYRRAFSKASRGATATDEVERLKTEVDRLRDDRKTAALLKAVSRHNVIDTEEVAELIRSHVDVDDTGGVVVRGEGGSDRIGRSGQAMGVDEYIVEWLEERPHHLRSSSASGSGSRGARFGEAGRRSYNLSDPESWRTMPREDLERLLKEGVNVEGASGQTFRFKDVQNPFREARKRKFANS
ncbi:MAG: hypothetical protein V3W31_10055 [Thermodesulfobacteriota bacterium]